MLVLSPKILKYYSKMYYVKCNGSKVHKYGNQSLFFPSVQLKYGLIQSSSFERNSVIRSGHTSSCLVLANNHRLNTSLNDYDAFVCFVLLDYTLGYRVNVQPTSSLHG